MVTDGLGVLSAEVTRVSERLRRLGHARLARPLDLALRPTPDPSLPTAPGNVTGVELEASYPSVADAAHALAQRLADLAADAEGRTRLPVPRLGDHAVGDGGQRLDADQLDLAVEMLRHLRLALP